MSRISNVNEALTTRKEQILNELKYYDKRIKDAQEQNKKENTYFNEDDSSDSDIVSTINDCTSITELRLKEGELQTCLEATQELTDLHILESQVNIMVDTPSFEGESPIVEEGLWREITAECRLDLVSFSLSFYAHQPERHFAPTSYRGLQVVLVKNIHEKELSCSVLPCLTAPSNAVEVIRSYALAHRSRRTTLAALAEKFGDCLFMEPLAEGGYVLKCANLLQISWTLQNKWSPVAPFTHKMSFDLEYLDESYIKKITNVHKKLSDPSVETDERTHCLATIIATCLEAHKNMGPEENMESDAESKNSKRLQTSDQESDNPNRESEIMGPPKALPKKVKPKNKQNVRKRGGDIDNDGRNKRAKTDSISDGKSNCESVKSNNNKEKFFKNNTEHTNVIRNSNELKENMPHKVIEKKSNAKKNINTKSNTCATMPNQILSQKNANSNNIQQTSENLPEYTENIKDNVKSSTQNKNTSDNQLNAQEINLNYNSAKSCNDTISNVVTEKNSKNIENKKSKSTVTKSKPKYGGQVSKTNKEVSGGNSLKMLQNPDGVTSNKKNAIHEVELRRKVIGKEKVVMEKNTENNGPDNGEVISEKELRKSKGNSKNNKIIKNVIKEKNNEIGKITAKPFTNKKQKNIVRKTSEKQTLSERFTSKMKTKDTIKNLNTKNDMQIRKNQSKKELNSHNIQRKDFDKNKESDLSNNIQLENYNNCENDNLTGKGYVNNNKNKTEIIGKSTKSKQNFQKSNVNKTKLVNNQKLRSSLFGNKVSNKNIEIIQKSKIPLKGSSVVKKIKTPLSILKVPGSCKISVQEFRDKHISQD